MRDVLHTLSSFMTSSSFKNVTVTGDTSAPPELAHCGVPAHESTPATMRTTLPPRTPAAAPVTVFSSTHRSSVRSCVCTFSCTESVPRSTAAVPAHRQLTLRLQTGVRAVSRAVSTDRPRQVRWRCRSEPASRLLSVCSASFRCPLSSAAAQALQPSALRRWTLIVRRER
jgi:hypothetical protein